ERRLIKTVSRRGYLLETQVFDRDATRTPGSASLATREIDALSAVSPASHARSPHETVANDVFAGERKLVTVLYADVKESLELCAERDPEEALTVFEAVLKLMTEAVRRYEGTLNLITTDGLIALFGVPLAHEDHAIRACNAALQIRHAVQRYGGEL